ncbi:ribonuclease [Oceanisphaera profunda]|uniref:Ribonuclease n=1 Tax=Oceanisphaera profunda TaxID=1416627 RepID=A0A1Y0D4C5_9GAMM|nr:PhoH family protein [Oceanisphaera profunda]ART82164.1 ribonuclease [Oceanisphaera profunda]
MDDNARKRFILDTNVLLHEPLSIYSFNEHHVLIPMTVLEELDRIKDRQKDVSRDARVAIRTLESLFHDATPEQIIAGVPLGRLGEEASGSIAIVTDKHLPEGYAVFTDDEADNRIINTALYLQYQYPESKTVLVTKDINMRLKAKGAGLKYVEDYRSDQLVDDIRLLAKGFYHQENSFWERVGECDSETRGREVIHTVADELLPGAHINQYLIDDTDDFAGRVLEKLSNKIRFVDLGRERMMGRKAWGIQPKNIYQAMALDALLDPNIELVILTGPAGSGKTLLAMAAALEMTIEKGIYDKVIVTRNTPEIAESIGFLPGTEEEKMAPWLAAITDTLEVLHKQDECMEGSLKYIMDKANLQFKSVNFMRGRSIQNTFVLLDECQNLTASQLKTIITRCGEGTKIVCSGNLAQIDSNYLTPVTSGLTYIVERFKDFEGSANVYLNGVMRSRLAAFAEENL